MNVLLDDTIIVQSPRLLRILTDVIECGLVDVTTRAKEHVYC